MYEKRIKVPKTNLFENFPASTASPNAAVHV